MKVKKAKPTVRCNFHLTISWNCLCLAASTQTQFRMKNPENGKISVMPATLILPASTLITLHEKTANCLNHRLFATQNTNYRLGHFSCLHGKESVSPLSLQLPGAQARLCWIQSRWEMNQLSWAGQTAELPVLMWGHRLWQGAEGGSTSHQNPTLELPDDLWRI